jgi:hypothetical protein
MQKAVKIETGFCETPLHESMWEGAGDEDA